MTSPVALITGALTGIGRATALAFAQRGTRLSVSGINEEDGRKLLSELRDIGVEAEFIFADVRDEEQVCRLVDRTMDRFGRLDAAVNCAGIESPRRTMSDSTLDDINGVLSVNVIGTFLAMKYEIRAMLPQGHGSIVNMSSIYGHKGYPKSAIYAASKHAIEGLTKSAALEVAAKGLQVNAIAPGPIETDMFRRVTGDAHRVETMLPHLPTKRLGQPEEVAEAIIFLALGAAGYITGQVLAVDGGLLAT